MTDEEKSSIEGIIQARLDAALRGLILKVVLPLSIVLVGWGVSVEVRSSNHADGTSTAGAMAEAVKAIEHNHTEAEHLRVRCVEMAKHRHPEMELSLARIDERMKGLTGGINEVLGILERPGVRSVGGK